MRFGHFEDESREYVIETPRIPYPWINYLGTEEFFSLISHTAGGYCFYRDARFRRLLRYRYNNVPTDVGGRYFFIRDGEDVWTPSWMPVKTELDRFECRHGLGTTRITGERNGVIVEQLALVPLGETAEVHQLSLTNGSDAPRKLSVFSFVEFCLWNAWDDQNNFQRNFSIGEVEIDGSAIYHVTEYRERRSHYAVFGVNDSVAGFDSDRESFVGLYNGLHEAEVPFAGESRNSVASGWAPIGSHHLEIELSPGETRSYVFTLGFVEIPADAKWESPGVVNKEPARALLSRFDSAARVQDAVDELRSYWSRLLDTFVLESPDPRLNRMVNTWNPYQCMVTFNMSRSASYFESGISRGMGFRDSNQDLLGFVHLIPERARARILDIAATQFADGSACHQYQPLTKQGNDDIGGGFNDDPLWLVEGVAAYVKETGDASILAEDVPFGSNPDDSAHLFEHLRRSLDHTLSNVGPHKLPLIGRADWNDCLNLNCFSENPDESYQTTANREGRTAESIFIAGLFVHAALEYADLAEFIGETGEAAAARKHAAGMREAVLEHGWDGEWFLRAYDFFGNKVGSSECEDGKIFIEPQGICVMAGIGIDEGCAVQALNSVATHLETDYGVLLNQPAYTRYHVELGEISSYPPGYKENGGIFCHNNPWVMIAETNIGRGERAFSLYKKIAPAYLEDQSEIHRTEPYVYSQMVAGKDAVRHGEAKNSWLTGTAAWNWVAIANHMLGVRPELDGLRVSPCISAQVPSFTVTRQCRGAIYRIKVDNDRRFEEPRLIVDGEAIDGTLVPWAPEGTTVEISCRT